MEKGQLTAIKDDPKGPEFASWRSYQRFEERVRLYRRHVWDKEIQAFLDTVEQTLCNRDAELQKDTVLWRAQLGIVHIPLKDDGEQYGEAPMGFCASRMKPSPCHTNEGRANSSGIPVLYLASNEETAISEVRPWLGSELSVAQFRVTRNLRAIDLTWGYGKSSWKDLTLKQLWCEEDVDAKTKEEAVWIDIDNAFSRPVTLSDTRDNYISTRILTELFKEAGFDAIVYRSQFGQRERDGHNVAIFELGNAEVLNCAPYEVESIKVSYKQTGNHWFSS